ncbi:MAG TPA: translation initiation factor IF-1 [Polyangiaceae bacterium]|jgi:translation initiation factor IF-1
MSADVIEAEGMVLSVGRGDLFKVEVCMGGQKREVLARRGGKLVKHRLTIVAGDRVRVEVSPYDLGRGRITYRI